MAQIIKKIMLGSEAFQQLKVPPFKAMRRGQWELKPFKMNGVCYSYFSIIDSGHKNNWALLKDGACWMSCTPMELESQGYHANLAYGTVVVCGLGMGVLVYNLMLNPHVNRIIVLEQCKDIIEIFNASIKAWNMPSKKLTVLLEDAKQFKMNGKADVLLADIWPTLGSEDAEPDTKAIQRNVRADRVAWWGQELDVISFCQRSGKQTADVDSKDIRNYERELGFRLLAGECSLYPKLVLTAGLSVVMAMQNRNKAA